MTTRKSVCFVSEENTCRSIIAEVYLRKHGRQYFEVQSFGLYPNRVHYLVKRVLSNRGVNPNYSFSKAYEVIENQRFDFFILMHPDLKERMPEIAYEHQLIIWEFEKIDLESIEAEAEAEKLLNQLSDEIEKQVLAFIAQYKPVDAVRV